LGHEAAIESRPSRVEQGVHFFFERSLTMGDGTADELRGRTKEAAGDLTGDKDLKREGKVDRASGTVKDKVGDAADKLKDTVSGKRD
jgi:uncharacterized protein YjbJ (UPF0337 family)